MGQVLNLVAALRRCVRKGPSDIDNVDNLKVAIMLKVFKVILFGVVLLLLTFPAFAEEVSREQIKGLDEQVQEIKGDVLGIAADLNQLEEKLLYPSNTQIAVFVALADQESFRLDSVTLELAGEPVAHHLYSYKELEALRKGGVQRIFTGNVRSGDQPLQVSFAGKSSGGADLARTERFTVTKGVGPAFVELVLAQQSITLKDR